MARTSSGVFRFTTAIYWSSMASAAGCCAAIKVRKSDNQGEKAFCRLRRREGGARPEAQATEELV
jgi:hypothetical protein